MPRATIAVAFESADPARLADIAALAESFRRSLRARNRSPRTVTGYLAAVRLFAAYLRRMGMPTAAPHIAREHVESFVAEQVEGYSANTAATRYRALQQLFRFCLEEGEIRASPMARMHPPTVPDTRPAVLGDDEIRRLLRACEGRDFAARRDSAIVRLLADTGMRASELAGIALADVDLEADTALVLGKGRRPRSCPFGQRTAAAIDRYLRARSGHRLAARPELWLGHAGPLTTSGLRQLLILRGRQAGTDGVHPHRFRHYFAHTFLSGGGQEHDLRTLAGWRSPQMIARYAASAAAGRAREAHRRLALGDKL